MATRDQRIAGSFTIDEAEEIAALASRLDRSLGYVIRLAVLNLLRESAQGSTAEEVQQ